MVDLAGSERQVNTGASGALLKQGAAINKSLSALAEVISKLSEAFTKDAKGDKGKGKKGGNKMDHIPYRNSKLTRILKQSLGGNTFTAVLLCMSPAPIYRENSVSTLKFGVLCKSIKNKARANVVKDSKTLLREYRLKIAQMAEELEASRATAPTPVAGSLEARHTHALSEESKQALEDAEQEAIQEKEKRQALEDKIEVMKKIFLQGGTGSGGPQTGPSQGATGSRTGSMSGDVGGKLAHTSSFSLDARRKGRRRQASVYVTSRTGGASQLNIQGPDPNALRGRTGSMVALLGKNTDAKDEAAHSWGATIRTALGTKRKEHDAAQKELKEAHEETQRDLDATRDDLSEKLNEAEEMRNEIARLNEQVEEIEEARTSLQQAAATNEDLREALEQQLGEVAEQCAQKEARNEELVAHYHDATSKTTTSEETVQQLRTALKERSTSLAAEVEGKEEAEAQLEEARVEQSETQVQLAAASRSIQMMQLKMVDKSGRRLSVVAVDIETTKASVENRERALSKREETVVDTESKSQARLRELDARQTRLQTELARSDRRAMLLDQRETKLADRETTANEMETSARKLSTECSLKEKDLDARAEAATLQQRLLNDREALISSKEEATASRDVSLKEMEGHMSHREENVKSEWARVVKTQAEATGASKIQRQFRSYLAANFTARSREVNEQGSRLSTRAAELEAQATTLSARWKAVQAGEEATVKRRTDAEAVISRAADLDKLMQEQAEEGRLRRVRLEEEEETVASDRHELDELRMSIEAQDIHVRGSLAELTMREVKVRTGEEELKRQHQQLLRAQVAASKLVAQAGEVEAREKTVRDREEGVVNTRGKVEAVHRAEVDDLMEQLNGAVSNTAMFKQELERLQVQKRGTPGRGCLYCSRNDGRTGGELKVDPPPPPPPLSPDGTSPGSASPRKNGSSHRRGTFFGTFKDGPQRNHEHLVAPEARKQVAATHEAIAARTRQSTPHSSLQTTPSQERQQQQQQQQQQQRGRDKSVTAIEGECASPSRQRKWDDTTSNYLEHERESHASLLKKTRETRGNGERRSPSGGSDRNRQRHRRGAGGGGGGGKSRNEESATPTVQVSL